MKNSDFSQIIFVTLYLLSPKTTKPAGVGCLPVYVYLPSDFPGQESGTKDPDRRRQSAGRYTYTGGQPAPAGHTAQYIVL